MQEAELLLLAEVGAMVHVPGMRKLVEKDCNPARHQEHGELELLTFGPLGANRASEHLFQ